MNDREHRTDTVCVYKPVTIGPQKKHWVEFQLLDEMGEPLANLPWRAINDAVRDGCVPEYSGVTDPMGVIRLEGLYPLDMTLLMDADPLAEVLQQRRLRAERPEPDFPSIQSSWLLWGNFQPSGFSPIEKQARAEGHVWHYLRIGQLCDRLPSFEPQLDNPASPPPYHFPDTTYSGFTARYEELNRRHVLEVCPLRAWSLILHHQTEYSLTNAYNFALMSALAYSKGADHEHDSIKYFFDHQCLDLARTPCVKDGKVNWPCVVRDVPFDERYTASELLDTAKAKKPEGHTQLMYAVSANQLLVAWRGTEFSGRRLPDLVTDITFRPVAPEVPTSCQGLVPCPDLTESGRVHLGFLESFELAHKLFPKDLRDEISELSGDRQFFICGHSLGGALALLHAAKLKDQNPLLYTYGMPRTFTLKAVRELSAITHFRHVNDTDTIPNVPVEADLDNHLYKLYGPLGTVMGLTWSIGQAVATQMFKFGDPYCHHGEIAMFYRATQHDTRIPDRPNGEKYGLRMMSIDSELPCTTVLHVVPSFGLAAIEQAEQAQGKLMRELDDESRARFFPPLSNLEVGGVTGILNHFMAGYITHLRDQLLEALNAKRDPELMAQFKRGQFKAQMQQYTDSGFSNERKRNELFMELHSMVAGAVEVTRQYEGGTEGLLRFDQLASKQTVYRTCSEFSWSSKKDVPCAPKKQ